MDDDDSTSQMWRIFFVNLISTFVIPPRGCSSMVEPQPSKLKTRVRFPSPALSLAAVAQLVERVLGKDEVTGPSPVSSFQRAC